MCRRKKNKKSLVRVCLFIKNTKTQMTHDLKIRLETKCFNNTMSSVCFVVFFMSFWSILVSKMYKIHILYISKICIEKAKYLFF